MAKARTYLFIAPSPGIGMERHREALDPPCAHRCDRAEPSTGVVLGKGPCGRRAGLYVRGSHEKYRTARIAPATPHRATIRRSPSRHPPPTGEKYALFMAWAKWYTGKSFATFTYQALGSSMGMKMSDRKSSGKMAKFTTAGAASALGTGGGMVWAEGENTPGARHAVRRERRRV